MSFVTHAMIERVTTRSSVGLRTPTWIDLANGQVE